MLERYSATQAAFALILSTVALTGWAQEKIEGLVTSTKMTMCKFEPGGCAGNLTLDAQQDGKVVPVLVQVPLGTPIKNGNENTYLPALRKNKVSISLKEENGEKVAKSINVISK
jgi:hypothetical protein